MQKISGISCLAVVLLCSAVRADKPDYDILATGSGRVVVFAPDFSVKWEYPAGNIHTAVQLLPSRNILFADGNVVEVTPDKKIVFEYKAKNPKEGSYACERLPNGNTLIGENDTGIVKELKPDGSVAFELQTQFKTNDMHHRMRLVHKLGNGNYLVCHSGDHLVREYTPKGEIVWEQKVPNIAFEAIRLKNGNTLISSLDQITEFTKEGKIVWEFKKSDLPDLGIRNMTGFDRLENGNLLIGCYSAYDSNGKGVGMFEITPEKKLVWAYTMPTDGRKIDKSMMGVRAVKTR